MNLDFSEEEVVGAQELISGRYTNLVLVRANLNGVPVPMIVAVIPDESGSFNGFVQPVAILVNDDLGAQVSVDGSSPVRIENGADPSTWGAIAIEHGGLVPVLQGIGLQPPPGPRMIDAMADHAARHGGLAIHSTDNGEWCVHVGPDSDERGCRRESFLEALTHGVEHHTPDPGPALLAEDDPRINSHLN